MALDQSLKQSIRHTFIPGCTDSAHRECDHDLTGGAAFNSAAQAVWDEGAKPTNPPTGLKAIGKITS